jgi:hypothetical protein
MGTLGIKPILLNSDPGIRMTEYTRRGFGTAFFSLLCVIEFILAAFVASLFSNTICFAFVFFEVLLLYKLGFHLWMLFDPTLTAGRGNAVKLNIFLGGSVILNVLVLLFASGIIGYTSQVQSWYFFAFIVAIVVSFLQFTGIPNSYIAIFVVISILPGTSAVAERYIYSISDDSECCLKHLKPWAASKEKSDRNESGPYYESGIEKLKV